MPNSNFYSEIIWDYHLFDHVMHSHHIHFILFLFFLRRQFTDAMTFQVFDLSVVKPSDFVHYGLSCLERLADQGDNCAKAAREKIRIVVCVRCLK